MTPIDIKLGAPDTDNGADIEISACLNPRTPKSFFLYAGAGSGKTRSLKDALDKFRQTYGDEFRRTGKKVAVITYTNAAADEIAARVGQDALFPISTIHSFCWAHIGAYHTDIQKWLLAKLPSDLIELREKQAKGRAGTKAALDRERAIAATIKRLDWLSVPRRFTYSPNGDNFGAASLSHSEVLAITSDFIVTKPSMQAVLVNKFPFLLIDESQDTNKVLIESFFALAAANKGKFALGLFGDTMQRIYADGLPDLGRNIPSDWARPAKQMNHRSTRRVVQLGNSIRAAVDNQHQLAREDRRAGTVRLFIGSANSTNKPAIEEKVRDRMASLCGDSGWLERTAVKTLTLEHHMAASRRGFLPMFQALDKDTRLSTGLRKGELAGLRLFTERVAPLILACSTGDKFGAMAHLRKTSPLLRPSALATSKDQADPLRPARDAVKALLALDVESSATQFLQVLQCVDSHGLFDIPTALRPFVSPEEQPSKEAEPEPPEDEAEEDVEASPSSLQAWRAFLETPYNQVVPFAEYISDTGPYGTHQGVKGLQFDRVLVVLDDSEARGFLFSYEKLFGTKPPSDDDRKKAAEGIETGIDRTRRLLYVTCTRAKESLALVAYTENPKALAEAVAGLGWFTPDEIETI